MAESPPDFVFVAGGARGDEALFRWANCLELARSGSRSGAIGAVTTLTAGTHATEAKAVLPQGWSLLDVLWMLMVPGEEMEMCGRRNSV